MSGILVDTSVWIDFFNGTASAQADALEEYLYTGVDIWITPTILQELLQGFQSDSDFEIARDLLLVFPIINVNPVEAALGAAALYRTARKHGITIRKSNDCLIAWHAIQAKLPILHKDRVFDVLASITELKVIKMH